MLLEVQQQDLVVGVRRAELPSRFGVAHRDGQRGLGGAERPARDADPTLDKRADHREEAPRPVLDRAVIRAVRVDVGVAVEQRPPWHANAVERQAAVVDAIEAGLVPAVGDRDALARRAVLGPDRHDECVDAVGLTGGHELCEDDRHAAVRGCVADVVLARVLVGGRDHERVGVRVIGRRRPDRLDVRAVPRLRHREAAGSRMVIRSARYCSWCGCVPSVCRSRRRTGPTARRP